MNHFDDEHLDDPESYRPLLGLVALAIAMWGGAIALGVWWCS